MVHLAIFAFLAGMAIAIQATMNARLGVLLHSPLLGTGVAFLFACLFISLTALLSGCKSPSWHVFKEVPFYLWFSGGALSAFGVGMFYYLIPKMGVGPMMSYALTGQLLLATVASHQGWFGLPVSPINVLKVIGMIALIVGMFLSNGGVRA